MEDCTDVESFQWPLSTTADHARDTGPRNVTFDVTPTQSEFHNHLSEHYHRKRAVTAVLCLVLVLCSDAVALALYICLGARKHVFGWFFLTWLVVSVGSTSILLLLVAIFLRNYLKTRRRGTDVADVRLQALASKGGNGIWLFETALQRTHSFHR